MPPPPTARVMMLMMPPHPPSTMIVIMMMIMMMMMMNGDVTAQLWPNYPEPGPDIHGRFCATRRSGCCPGRDDRCTMPILDTVCYCDEFCIRTQADCCPDFAPTCTHRPESQTLISK
ncbi:hypothetical protein LSH36_229g00031 [Paralvinella palmiformis]|uniref:SMB domain-containing protein n=1 Tax=Paralvinella palmiformis TaxID=53620 RepID=A0AAD9JN86_9ANNE|nr:hypothetical protein LSH36_229g00031 [Paralvinella palmiformis]